MQKVLPVSFNVFITAGIFTAGEAGANRENIIRAAEGIPIMDIFFNLSMTFDTDSSKLLQQ
jgi:hypothetical protein